MSDPFLGEIRMTGFNFAPVGWYLCQGQALQISQASALFALLGTFYGGDGVHTFNLPDLRGRVPLCQGQGAGLPNYPTVGQSGGAASVTISAANLPAHSHPFAQQVSSAVADQVNPTGAIPAESGGRGQPTAPAIYTRGASNGTGAAQVTGLTGSNAALNIEPPYLVINFIIAYAGIFPSRS